MKVLEFGSGDVKEPVYSIEYFVVYKHDVQHPIRNTYLGFFTDKKSLIIQRITRLDSF